MFVQGTDLGLVVNPLVKQFGVYYIDLLQVAEEAEDPRTVEIACRLTDLQLSTLPEPPQRSPRPKKTRMEKIAIALRERQMAENTPEREQEVLRSLCQPLKDSYFTKK